MRVWRLAVLALLCIPRCSSPPCAQTPTLNQETGMPKSTALPIIVLAAAHSEAATSVPADLTAAQCALESGWLDHMPEGTNNPFGIKGNHLNGLLAATHEWFNDRELKRFLAGEPGRTATAVLNRGRLSIIRGDGRTYYAVRDWFHKYATLAEAFTAHATLIRVGGPYRQAFLRYRVTNNLPALIEAIAPHYAKADPAIYSQSVLSIIRDPAFKKALDAARYKLAG